MLWELCNKTDQRVPSMVFKVHMYRDWLSTHATIYLSTDAPEILAAPRSMVGVVI